jgi:mannose-6-phosphate isomerase-like protein (cupin superfamily)
MADARPQMITADTLGNGIHDPYKYCLYSEEAGTPVRIYADQDISWLTWNLLPGQENSTHVHPERAHSLIVLTGSGLYVLGDGPQQQPIPVQKGVYILVPRGTIHGMRNTGAEPLSYITISNNNQAVNTRTPVGEQQRMVMGR